jgi:hypothetical protein
MGHLQTCAAQDGMSASPLKADIIGRERDIRFGPIAEIGGSFDYLIGAGEQRLGDIQAQRLGRLQVDDQLEFGRRLHWQIAWSRSLTRPDLVRF